MGKTFSNAIRAPVAPATAATLEATTVLQGQVEASPAHVGSSPKQLVQTPLTVGKNKRKSHSTSQQAIPDSRDPVPMQQRTHNSANAQTITSTDVEHNISKFENAQSREKLPGARKRNRFHAARTRAKNCPLARGTSRVRCGPTHAHKTRRSMREVSTESLAVTTLLTKRHANIGCERYPQTSYVVH